MIQPAADTIGKYRESCLKPRLSPELLSDYSTPVCFCNNVSVFCAVTIGKRSYYPLFGHGVDAATVGMLVDALTDVGFTITAADRFA